MKYKAKQMKNGKWAVYAGNSYFVSTLTDDQTKAEKEALILSAQWYYSQAEKAWEAAEKEGLLGEYDTCLGDWLC